MTKKAKLACLQCPQYSNGTCLVLSVNVKKYGKPKECTL